MALTNYFPDTVKIKGNGTNGSVNVNGVVHGYPDYSPPIGTVRTFDSRIKGFRPQDYLLLEGQSYRLANETDEDKPIWRFLLHIPQIKNSLDDWVKRAELTEFYFYKLLWNPVDERIVQEYSKPHLNPAEEVRKYGEVTFVSHDEAESFKQASIGTLVERLEDVSREEIALFLEKFNTLRSLLFARTSTYRALALGAYPVGGTVNLFVGVGHTGETLRFLRRPETVQQYLSKSHEEIRDIYARNEDFQEEVTEAFHRAIGNQRIGPKD